MVRVVFPACVKNSPFYYFAHISDFQHYLWTPTKRELLASYKMLFHLYICLSVHTSSEITSFKSCAVADPRRGHEGCAPHPRESKLFQFRAVFGKIICWHPPWRVGAPTLGKSWIRHCYYLNCNMCKYEIRKNHVHEQFKMEKGGVPWRG